MTTFEAILVALALTLELINWWRITEVKDEIARLKAIVNYNKQTSDMRYKELKGVCMSKYEEIARIYGEEKNNEIHA